LSLHHAVIDVFMVSLLRLLGFLVAFSDSVHDESAGQNDHIESVLFLECCCSGLLVL
jgi:hypothetical protein